MKLGPGIKLFFKKKLRYVILVNCDVIVNFPIYGQFGAIRKPVNVAFSLIVTFYLTKTESRTKRICNTALILLNWEKVLFLTKILNFLQKVCLHQQN